MLNCVNVQEFAKRAVLDFGNLQEATMTLNEAVLNSVNLQELSKGVVLNSVNLQEAAKGCQGSGGEFCQYTRTRQGSGAELCR